MAIDRKHINRELIRKTQVIEDLLVVIDTAQAALRRAEATIKDPKDKEHVFNPSAKWVMNFKLED